MEQRTFPIRVRPVEGEALESWLDRYCSTLSTSRKDLYSCVGLRPSGTHGPQSRGHSLRVSDVEAARIGLAAGIAAQEVQRLTLGKYEGRVLFFHETRDGVDIRFLWARGTGTRYCPGCLRDDPGVWRLRWRLSWSFACTRHGSLLVDACPGCGLVPRSRPRLGEVPLPNICDNAISGSNGRLVSCSADLSQVRMLRLPADSPILATQAWLDSAIDSEALTSSDLQRLLNDLKMLAGRALRVMSADDLMRWNRTEQVPGLVFDIERSRRRTGLFHPRSGAVTAHAVSLAAMVVRSEDERVYVPIIRRLLSDRAGNALKVFPSSFNRHWGEPSPELERKMLKALHADIGPQSALRYRTAGPAPSPPSKDRSHILARCRSVPQRFWPGWTHLLQLDGQPRPKMLQTALSIGVLLPGYDRPDLKLQKELLGLAEADGSFSYVFRRGSTSTGNALMQTLLRLASYLDEHPAPIDYERRRRLSLDELLPLATWQAIVLGLPMSGNAPATARLYLAYRVTGSLPEHTQRGGRGYFLIQNFIASTPAGVLDLLDERANAFLAENAVAEPLCWEPPTILLKDLIMVERPLGGHDPIAHAMISRGLVEPRLISQREQWVGKAIEALRPGTDSFEVRLRRSLDLGESVEDMARGLSKSARMIRHHIARLGCPPYPGNKVQLDPEKIREMYLVGRRTAREIAEVTGWDENTIGRRLRLAGVTLRGTGGGSARLGIDAYSYSKYPELLKKALRGPHAKARLQRFTMVSAYPTMAAAVRDLGLSQSALVRQIKALERDVGGELLARAHGKRAMQLTGLGSTLIGLGRESGLVTSTLPCPTDARNEVQGT